MTPLILIIGGLVTWKTSYMLVKDTGPLDIFARFRAFLATRQKKAGGWFDMFSCIGCVSVYVGATTALWPAESFFEWVLYTLAFSAIATLIERVTA